MYLATNGLKISYYDIKFASSKIHGMKQTGISCIKLKKDERAVARPFVNMKRIYLKCGIVMKKRMDTKLVMESLWMEKNG